MFNRKPKSPVPAAVMPQSDPELAAALEVIRELVKKFHEKSDSIISAFNGTDQ